MHDHNSILKFWFEKIKPEQWFKKDPEFDKKIQELFEQTYWEVVAGEHSNWRQTPEGRLAEIIVLDQFSRNIFRDTPQAFANDTLALALAQEAVSSGDDQKLSKTQRSFLYMPFMHSESAKIHVKAMELFGKENNLEYEIKHKEIIDQFGRYPHRNKTLGRKSTSEEIEFLKKNTGF